MWNSMQFSPDGRSGASVGITLEEAEEIARAQPRNVEGTSAGLSAIYLIAEEPETCKEPSQPSLFIRF